MHRVIHHCRILNRPHPRTHWGAREASHGLIGHIHRWTNHPVLHVLWTGGTASLLGIKGDHRRHGWLVLRSARWVRVIAAAGRRAWSLRGRSFFLTGRRAIPLCSLLCLRVVANVCRCHERCRGRSGWIWGLLRNTLPWLRLGPVLCSPVVEDPVLKRMVSKQTS